MKKATAKLMFLSALFLIASIACMPAVAGVSSGMRAKAGIPPGKPPKPRPGPSAPDGTSPFPQPCAPNCGYAFAPR
jgi:hypothetical protein